MTYNLSAFFRLALSLSLSLFSLSPLWIVRFFFMASSPFDGIPVAPPDVIFGVLQQFKADPAPNKVNLSVGAYRTDDGKPYVLKAVRRAEEILVADHSLNKEYLPIEGLPGLLRGERAFSLTYPFHSEFLESASKILFGPNHPVLKEKRLAIAQSLSGTGALRIAAEFIRSFFPHGTVGLEFAPLDFDFILNDLQFI
jgi:aspartate/tyrosine/aromatic aminotransferase